MDPSNKSVSPGSSSNKIRQIVRLQQLLKKWKKIAAASPSSTHLHNNLLSINNSTSSSSSSSSTKSINKFLKKTLSFTEKDRSSEGCSINSSDAAIPKGCLAVSVGKEDKEEVKRFVIPMDYLGHPSFQVLLREAEEEFGFQQQGLLKIPCEVSVFDKILKNINSNNKIKQPPPAAHDHDAFFQLQQPHHSSDLSTINVVVDDNNIIHNVGCCSPDNHQHHQGIMPPQLCS